MSITSPLDLVESLSSLVVSQSADKLPEQALSLSIVESSEGINLPNCQYDEILTKSLIFECWQTFCSDLRRDPSGLWAFERLVGKLQTTFLFQAMARNVEFEKKRSSLEAEIKSISLVVENKQRETERETEAKINKLISSHEAKIIQLTSSHETEKHEIELKKEAKIKKLISSHEAKIIQLTSSHETEKHEIELKKEAKIKKLISSHEAKIIQLASSHEIEKHEIERKKEARINKLISSHEIEKHEIDRKNEARINKLISSHEIEKYEIERKNEARINNLISSYKIEEQAIRSAYERSLDTAKAEQRADFIAEKRACEATVQAQIHHLASQQENIDHLRQEVAILQEKRLLASFDGAFTGSFTRSDAWKGIKSNINHKIDQVFVTFSEEELVPESSVRHLVDQVFSDEKDMYEPVSELMTELLANTAEGYLGVQVFDTHKTPFLSGYMPDITVTLGNLKKVDQLSVYCVVELKKTSKLDDAAFGQTVDYLFALRRLQPSRRFITALLSNIQENYIITLENKNRSDYCITQYASVSFAKAMTYIKNVVLKEPRYFPTVPAFSALLGTMEKRLGNPQNSVVGEFEAPAGSSAELVKFETMAVKRAAAGMSNTDIVNEISLLEFIRDRGGCSQLPTLLYVSDSRDEFGIAPVGVTLDRNNPGTGPIIRRILKNVLDGIQWLHRHNIVHRDIRWDNIVIHNGQAYLIDFGNSVMHDRKPKFYAGGYICCPKELIGDMDKEYIPEFADDYMAFLLLISLLLFPASGRGMTSRNLATDSSESKRLKRFWREMEESTFWKHYYQAALAGDGVKLSELFNLEVIGYMDHEGRETFAVAVHVLNQFRLNGIEPIHAICRVASPRRNFVDAYTVGKEHPPLLVFMDRFAARAVGAGNPGGTK